MSWQSWTETPDVNRVPRNPSSTCSISAFCSEISSDTYKQQTLKTISILSFFLGKKGLPHHFLLLFTCYVTILIDFRVSDPKNIPRKNTLISKSSKVIFNLNRAFVKFLVLLNNLNVTRAQVGYLNNLEQLKKSCMNKNRKQESTSHS